MVSSTRRPERPALPAPNFPEQLPVSARRDDIARAIGAHPVVIVCGETGSGKTTQLPKIAWLAGRGRRGLIGHTQPRRLAATSVARRIAQELGSPLGTHVGYKIRFNEAIAPSATIKLMTDGVLLAETQSDPRLHRYDTIIVDEAHERSLNIDFLLGYLKQLLDGPRRDDLRVVITSATIDAERFAEHFARDGQPAPVIEVSGRLYPVELRYLPLAAAARGAPARGAARGSRDAAESRAAGVEPEARPRAGLQADAQAETEAEAVADTEPETEPEAETDEVEASLPQAVEAAIEQLWRRATGDVLVFLPGEREIRDCMEHLRRVPAIAQGAPVELLPLFARLSAADQERVFAASSGRRVVLATNVAETSLTVPGIRYVIDSGLARVKRYRYRGKVEQLLVEPISQAAADQRAGRCGRVADGVCIRLYDEQHLARQPRFTDPEVLRSSLAAVILRMKALKLTEVEHFPFVDPPPRRAVVDGYDLLHELNALDDSNDLTKVGRTLARLPVDPRIGRMLLAGQEGGCLGEVLLVASALSVQDPRERPLDARQAADRAHARHADERSDFVGFINLWHYWQRLRAERGSRRALDERLKREFLSPRRLREWADVHAQLVEAVGELGWKVQARAPGPPTPPKPPTPSEPPKPPKPPKPPEPPGLPEPPAVAPDRPALSRAEYERLHRALLAGLLGNLGMRSQEAEHFLGTHGVRFWLHPGSGMARRGARWVMAAELVQTQRLYARTVARIEPGWIERTGAHLLRRSWTDPHWEQRPAHVVAYERAVLYGLTLYAQRRVHYGPREPKLARELLIRQALIAGEWDTRLRFFGHNRKLIAEIEALEHRTRRLDLLVDEQTLYEFYDALIPAQVITGAALEAWYREASRELPGLLFLERDALLRREVAGAAGEQFPHTLKMHGAQFEVSYRFEPGAPADGATLQVPMHALNQVDAVRCEWEVPGLLRDKVAALLKSLPQRPRHRCQPLADFAASFIERARDEGWSGARPLLESLAEHVRQRVHLPVQASDFRSDAIPGHLLLRFALLDEYGREIAASRNLAQLRAEHGQAARERFRDIVQAAPAPRAAAHAATAGGDSAAGQGSPAAVTPQAFRAGERYTGWSFGTLPELLELQHTGADGSLETLIGFPALVDRGDAVELQVFDEADLARRTHRAGLRRLFALALREPLRHFERNIPDFTRLGVRFGAFGGADELCAQLVAGTVERCCMSEPLPDSAESFAARIAEARPRVNLVGQELARLAAQILEQYATVGARLAQAKGQPETVADISAQLEYLMGGRFLAELPQARLMHFPRYLKAIAIRLEKLRGGAERDREHRAQIGPLQQNYRRALSARKGREDAQLEEFRWLLEELRVSLFAQELRTPSPVSVKRLQRAWDALSR